MLFRLEDQVTPPVWLYFCDYRLYRNIVLAHGDAADMDARVLGIGFRYMRCIHICTPMNMRYVQIYKIYAIY